jgi:putative transposase
MVKGRHFDRSVILLCVRWYLAYGLSLRDLEEMMTERGISVDQRPTIAGPFTMLRSCWSALIDASARSPAGGMSTKPISGSVDVGCISTAPSTATATQSSSGSASGGLTAAKRFLHMALKRHGRPERIVIDGTHTNREAILSCDTADRLQDRTRRDPKPIRIRQSAYLNNRIEQDHRAIKRRIRPMLGFKSLNSARAVLGGIEMVHMMRKRQAKYAHNLQPSLAERFDLLGAWALHKRLILSRP